ncbi:type I-E CRISPR-associated protein Cas5/CasD [Bifidobacterium callitrichos]|nr:type I-E CRISPR-associated protein Cas5/CasD [Bifidobacterium callitrichos]
MSTVLLTLKGPLQSWSLGIYQHHPAQPRPTKSGVIGLIASAMGLERDHYNGLERLRYGVRVIKAGRPLTELQTTGMKNKKDRNPLTWHGYMMDAEYLVGIEAQDKACKLIEHAIRHPVYAPYLGRRDCPPAGPIPVTTTRQTLEQALQGPGDTYLETPDGQPVWDQPHDGRDFGSRGETHIHTNPQPDPFDTAKKANQA